MGTIRRGIGAESSAPRCGTGVGQPLRVESLESRRLLAAGILVNPQSISIGEGKSVAVTLRLKGAPEAPVVLTLSSSNPDAATFATSTVTFLPGNWNKPQKVTLRGVEDFLKDGSQAVQLSVNPTESADPTYAALPAIAFAANVKDSGRTNPFAIKLGAVSTSERDGAATTQYSIKLNAQPVAEVTIPIQSDTPSEGVASVDSITFTSVNWNVFQAVRVRGVDDQLPDGATKYFVINGPAVSEDRRFAGRDPADVRITNKAWYYPSLYDGTYAGQFGGSASGTIDVVTIKNGTVTVSINVTTPALGGATGVGTVSPSGKFSITASGAIAGAVFRGNITLSQDRSLVVGSGVWKHPLASGGWAIARPLGS
ncbi:MAG: hypothetical protein ACKO5R_03380 [Planctomycetaceae bacterium]